MPMKKTTFTSLAFVSLLLLSCNQQNTLFTALPSSQTNITFENTLKDGHRFNILYYLYYYNGGGVSAGDINNDGLPDIYFTASSRGNNKLYLNKGNFQFEDITAKAGVAGTADWCTGVTMVDINGDGYLDIYVSAMAGSYGLKGHNELFVNNHNGTFTESSVKYGLDFSGHTTQTGFFDYDHDGDMDCYILNQSQKPHANIVDTANRHKFDPLSGDRFYRNDVSSTGKFTDVSAAAGIYQSNLGYGLGLAMADLNNDGWEDIYIGNDFHENDYYYLNNGNGTFTESGAKYFNHYSRFSMGNDIADYDNDGQLDVVTVDMLPPNEKVLKTYGSDENADTYKLKLTSHGYQHQSSKNCLQHNNGNGSSFSETSLLSGVSATDWSWCPLFADFDNDGNKDLFISSGIVKRPVDMDYIRFVSDLAVRKGMSDDDQFDAAAIEKMPDGSSHPFLYKGSGGLSFKDMSNEWGTGKMKGYFNGSAYADLDNDGNLDLVMNCLNAPAVILKNNAPKKNFCSIAFKADSGNTFGIGCKAYLFQKGKMQYQQLMLTRGFESSSDTRLHFGLDSLAAIDSLLVVWPNQQYQLLKNPAANKQLIVQQKDAAGTFDYTAWFKPETVSLEELASDAGINWRHRENNFNDFDYQYLLPHAESTRGPKIAVADVNGDGLDDLYACGAKGQAGTLLLQQSNGSFIISDTSVFNKDAACEDVDAIFFDANGDGKPDLYVVSGGNEFTAENDAALLDRIYLNDGKGHFTAGTKNLPPLFKNKSCVAAADVDHDGDIDLFVGTLADPNAYGIPQTSYLFLNDGKGNFYGAANNDAMFKDIGLVTAAAFIDVNKDGWQDLVVTGEFMPIEIFINKSGKLQKTVLPQSTGLWQTVFMDDVNGDGNVDILAGNWGWNNKFWSGKNGPLKMYVADFDKNGRTEQLLSYTLEGKEYPFLAKDEVERPLPLLKKHYLMYAEYAGEEMKDVFYGWIDTIQPVMAEHLGSAVCYGDGQGNFTMNDLPAPLQLAPVFSFQKIEKSANNSNLYIAGGNFFDVIPYEGRYDAQPLELFSINNKKQVRPVMESNLFAIKGQVRDVKWINGSGGKTLLVARNDDKLISFKRK